jgi:hypothetical protein
MLPTILTILAYHRAIIFRIVFTERAFRALKPSEITMPIARTAFLTVSTVKERG